MAFLGWPVKLGQGFQKTSAHITLKFLGAGRIEVNEIAARLKFTETRFLLTSMKWEPSIFDGGAHVMIFSDVDPAVYRTRRLLESLTADDYPAWRPHVTLPQDLWHLIQAVNLPVDQVLTHIGPLTLYVNDHPMVKY